MTNYIADGANHPFTLVTNDRLYVPHDVHAINDAHVVQMDNAQSSVQIAIDGHAVSFSSDVFELGGDFAAVVVGPQGRIQSLELGAWAGISFFGDGSSLLNFGTITGGDAVYFENGSNFRIENHGNLSGFGGGTASVDSRGIALADGQNTGVFNTGLITGYVAIAVSNMDGARIVNSGEILSALPGGTGLEIQGTSSNVEVINSGLVSAEFAFAGGAVGDVLVNSGVLQGGVTMGGGGDTYRAIGAGLADSAIQGGTGDDTLIGAAQNDTLWGQENNDLLQGRGGDDQLDGGEDNDTVQGGAGDDTLDGGTGDDVLQGGVGFDEIIGEDGRDTLVGQGGNDTLNGGLASDSLMGGNGYDYLLGEAGFDTLMGGLAGDTLDGGSGQDELWGQGGEDSLSGGDQSDRLFGGGLHDTLDGGAGFDLLDGGRGDDVLDGGQGNDTLTGGRGDDELTGGVGADVFVFGWVNGDDVITDFQNTFDRIDLSALNVGLPQVIAAVSAVGTGAVMLDLNALGASGTVLIDGVPLAGIGGGDFIL